VFNAANALVCLATVFEEASALQHLESFVALNGANWYQVAPNDQTITLQKTDKPTALPESLVVGDETVVPFDPARELYWQVV
jgi:dihydroorotase